MEKNPWGLPFFFTETLVERIEFGDSPGVASVARRGVEPGVESIDRHRGPDET
jgi:hypothetical protein